MMTLEPLVSFCIPTYNRANVLARAINSALLQSYSNIEVIVSDNASEDNTDDVVYSFNDKRLHYYKQKNNVGMAENFQLVTQASRGKYFVLLSSDDWVEPDFIRNAVNVLEQKPYVGVYHAACRIVDHNGDCVSEYHRGWSVGEHSDAKLILQRNKIILHTAVIRREAYDQLGPWDLHPACDWLLWMRIMLGGWSIWTDDLIVGHYTQSIDAGSHRLNDPEIVERFKQIVINQIIPLCTNKRLQSAACRGIADSLFRAAVDAKKRGEYRFAWQMFVSASGYHPYTRWRIVRKFVFPRLMVLMFVKMIKNLYKKRLHK